MTVATYAKPSTGTCRLPPAFVTDLPVLVMLVLAWVTVPVFWAHLATGLALIAIVGMHSSTRRRLPVRGVRIRRRLAYAVFLVAAAAMAVTGLVRWAGVPHEYVWHGGISYLLLGLAGGTCGRFGVLDVANVIWCTGYRPDYSWIALPHFPRDEQPAHQRGAVLDHPGLYVIGLPLLFRMASSLVGGVGSDARHIAHLIARDQRKADRSSHERRNEGTRI